MIVKVSVSLGKILLELFSKGQYLSIQFSSLESTDNGEDDDTTMPSVAKRMASVAISDSISEMAKNLLLDLGTPLSICRLVCDLLDGVEHLG